MDTHQKLIDLIDNFDEAMLVTRAADDSLCARPMVVAQFEEEGALWFVTDQRSGMVHDVLRDGDVAVTMQGSNQYVSLSGRATPVEDQAKLDELWQESWKVWFPQGKTSPSIVLLRVDVKSGEYWDNSGATGLKYLVKAGQAYLQGERPSQDSASNASVSL